MRNFVIQVLLFAALITSAFAKDCLIDDFEFNVGEKYLKVGMCLEYTCIEVDTTIAVGCGDVEADPRCKRLQGDFALKYPECCDHYDCSNVPVPTLNQSRIF